MAAQTLRILVIEDNPGDVRLLEEMLVPTGAVQFEVQSFGNLSDGLAAVSDFEPAVILLDLGLGESQGLETFTAAQEGAGGVPIVILSGLGDEAGATEAVAQGAQDGCAARSAMRLSGNAGQPRPRSASARLRPKNLASPTSS